MTDRWNAYIEASEPDRIAMEERLREEIEDIEGVEEVTIMFMESNA